jgi:hypothetical protein
MLLLTLLIKCDKAFLGRDGLNHLAGGLRHSSITGMCLAFLVKSSPGGFSRETPGKPDVFSNIHSNRYIADENGAFFF